VVNRPPGDDRLKINVTSLLAEPAGSRRDHALPGLRLDLADLVAAAPIDVLVRLTRTNRGLVLDGGATTTLAGTCSRCLKPAATPIDVAIDEELLPSVDLASGQAVDTSEEPEALRLTDHHEVDLEPLIREAILLAEPIAPLCRPDCPGLCPVCGLELEIGVHDHEDGPIDPRLEALRAFRVDETPGTG
jgi:uncharacterized protein